MATPLTRRACICTLAFLLASKSRAEGLSIGVDVGAIAKEIKEFVIYMLEKSKNEEAKRLKESAASVSQRMSRIAAMKESFADFLEDKPSRIREFPLRQQAVADRELRAIDRELGDLEKDLRRMDPDWSSKHTELYNRLFRISHAKGLKWAAEYGPQGQGQNVDEFRGWMRQEAAKLKGAASEIQNVLSLQGK